MLRDCISLLREWSTAPVLDIPAFINSLIFNVLIGNADAHGKNYSLLYSGGEQRLSPFYDLVSTLAWPELSKNLAMKIGGCDSVSAFTIGDWKKMAGKAGLGWPMIRERMAEISQAMLNELDTVRKQTRECNGEVAKRLHEIIGNRSAKMLEALSRQDRSFPQSLPAPMESKDAGRRRKLIARKSNYSSGGAKKKARGRTTTSP